MQRGATDPDLGYVCHTTAAKRILLRVEYLSRWSLHPTPLLEVHEAPWH